MTAQTNPFLFRNLKIGLIQVALTIVAIFIVLKPWLRSWEAPFNYEADTIYQLVLVKSIITNGWFWFIPHLNAPFTEFAAVTFPQNTTLTSLGLKLISLFTAEPGLVLNMFWLGSIVATSLTCHLALRILRTPSTYAYVFSTLYALLPFTLMRNTNHIVLTYTFVPLIASYTLLIMSQQLQTRKDSSGVRFPGWLLTICIIAIGFDYIYTAFFSCFFLIVAGLFGALQSNAMQPLRLVLRIVALIATCALINQSPSLINWFIDGMPPNMGYKSIADAEVYGLKIRHLLTPPSLAEYFALNQQHEFIFENENQSASLGWIGALGYLAGIGLVLSGKRNQCLLGWASGGLIIGGTLLGTIGGFGTIFNLLFTTDIRAYNRVSVFIAFFSFIALIDILRTIGNPFEKLLASSKLEPFSQAIILRAIVFAIFLLALLDQGTAAKEFIAKYSEDSQKTREERHFINQIEQSGQRLTMLYQLPETNFPVDPGLVKMKPYDHGRTYIWSKNISWSWPNFSHQKLMWLQAIGNPSSADFLEKLSQSGFDGIWLDRFGYTDENLLEVEKILDRHLGSPSFRSSSNRYSVYRLNSSVEKNQGQPNSLLNPPFAYEFSKGFYPVEYLSESPKTPHRWAKKDAQLILINYTDKPLTIIFEAQMGYNEKGKLTVTFGSEKKIYPLVDGKSALALEYILEPNSRNTLRFHYDGQPVIASGDTRKMFLSFTNPVVRQKQ
jgi:phosphoglycerol transferase